MHHVSFQKRWAQKFKLFLPVPTYIFSTVLPSDRTEPVGTTVQHRRFPLNIRKSFFTTGVTEHWHRLRRKVVESLSFKVIQKPAERDPGQLALGGWAGTGGWHHITSRAPFQPQSFCNSVILQLVDKIKVVLNVLVQPQICFQGAC